MLLVKCVCFAYVQRAYVRACVCACLRVEVTTWIDIDTGTGQLISTILTNDCVWVVLNRSAYMYVYLYVCTGVHTW